MRSRRDPTKEGGTVLEQFAKSPHGRNIYELHDNGFAMAESQAEMTEFQERLFLTAMQYWEDKKQDEAERKSSKYS